MNLVEYLRRLITVTVFENALDDATAVWMRGQLVHLTLEWVDNEVEMFWWDAFDYFLHDVIAVLIFDTLKTKNV